MESEFIKNIKVTSGEDSNEDYHGKLEYCSASTLKKIKKSPLHWKEQVIVQTDAMAFGTAYHTFMLEPDKFWDDYYLFNDEEGIRLVFESDPEIKSPRATKVYKEWLWEYEAQNQGKIKIDESTYSKLKAMRARIYAHPYAKSLIRRGVAEVSHYAEIETFDGQTINAKIRPDYLKIEKRICVDLKTCVDASADGFQKNAAKFDYHIQAALYTDILERTYQQGLPWKFFFIAQEKTPPFAFNIFEASPQFIGQGRYEYEMLMLLWKQCQEDGDYPGYQVWCENKYGVNPLNLPTWAVNEINFFNHKF